MATFLMLTKLTDEGRKTVRETPQRIKEVNQEVLGMGVKIVAQYALLGEYDFANVLEAPNVETVIKVAIDLGARGTLQTVTLPALGIDDFIRSVK